MSAYLSIMIDEELITLSKTHVSNNYSTLIEFQLTNQLRRVEVKELFEISALRACNVEVFKVTLIVSCVIYLQAKLSDHLYLPHRVNVLARQSTTFQNTFDCKHRNARGKMFVEKVRL